MNFFFGSLVFGFHFNFGNLLAQLGRAGPGLGILAGSAVQDLPRRRNPWLNVRLETSRDGPRNDIGIVVLAARFRNPRFVRIGTTATTILVMLLQMMMMLLMM